jgi:apolipoprotein N-acyltransferase
VLAEIVFRLDSGDVRAGDELPRRVLDLQRSVAIPMLVGEEARTRMRLERVEGGIALPFDQRFNSAYLLLDGHVAAPRYDKIRLTPFGETMPYIRFWPWLQDRLLGLAATGMHFDLAAGRERAVFTIPGFTPIRAVTPICFESTVASLCRSLVFDSQGRRRVDLIVNLTNDGWFGASLIGRLQHLQAARWRSLELGTPTLRAANTGVSAIIDARGRVVAWGVDGRPGAAFVDGVLSGQVALNPGSTPYARVGDLAGWVALAAGFLLVLAVAIWRTPSRPAE